jgi:assimilatory nitrate reductase catalytic subunit
MTMSPEVRTTCPYCGVGCGLVGKAGDARKLAIAPDNSHPANQGRICSKGAALGDTIGLAGRLRPDDSRPARCWKPGARPCARGFGG